MPGLRKLIFKYGVARGRGKSLDDMTLEEAMLSLFNVAYWPMTEAAGNAIDQKANFDVKWNASIARADYALPSGAGSIPTFNGSAEGAIESAVFAAFAAAFPKNKGSLAFIARVPDVATWESTDNSSRHIFNFSTSGAGLLYATKVKQGVPRGYRNSNWFWDVGGRTKPVLYGLTWEAPGNMKFFINGEEGVSSSSNQVAWAGVPSSTYTRIGADTTFGTNKWLGQIGYVGLGSGVLTADKFKALFKKIWPTTRKFFIIGDSKSTGANFWPGYLQNLLDAGTGDYWTDGPRRYGIGGYDVTSMDAFMASNFAAETETPEFILINMGTNDARPVTITAEAVFKEKYHSIISRCQTKFPGVPIFCQKIYRADSAQTITNSATINGYITDIIADYATGVYVGPDDAVYIENGDAGVTYLTTDKIHYSVAAHAQVAAQWFSILQAASAF